MYLVTNITKSTQYECDAIETITVVNNEYIPVEHENADGFNAMKIIQVSPSEQYYQIETFVYEGHTLKGTEDTGKFEDIPEPEPDEDDIEDE